MADDGWRLGYRPGLDGLRGIAVVLVLFTHWWPDVFPGGGAGVDLFFVLSGFLITRLIAEEVWTSGSLDIRAFYLRRIRRLLPASTLLVLTFIGSAGAGWVLLYSANWARINGVLRGGPLEHTWSLAIEEQFYLLWPLVLVGAVLRVRRPLLLVTGMICAVALHRVSIDGASWHRVGVGTDTRIDSMLVGAAAALAISTLLRWRVWTTISAALCPLLVLVVLRDPDLQQAGYTVLAAAWAVVVVWALGSSGWICARPLRWLGALSYSLYLWHFPVTWLIRDGSLYNSSAIGTAVAIPLSFALALVSYHVVERPFRRSRAPRAPDHAEDPKTVSLQPSFSNIKKATA